MMARCGCLGSIFPLLPGPHSLWEQCLQQHTPCVLCQPLCLLLKENCALHTSVCFTQSIAGFFYVLGVKVCFTVCSLMG